jgi:hypothetical protein
MRSQPSEELKESQNGKDQLGAPYRVCSHKPRKQTAFITLTSSIH